MNPQPGKAGDNGGKQSNFAKIDEKREGGALVARCAYEKWQARGCPEGGDRRDWFEAEQELLAAPASKAHEEPSS